MKISIPTSTIVMGLALLKLTNTWNISWWWVFAPYWVPMALVAAFWCVAVVAAVIVSATDR